MLSGGGAHFHALLLTPGLKTFFAGTHFGLFRSDDRGINAFDFLPDKPEVIFALTHEGVVAARRLSEGNWTPLAQLQPEPAEPAGIG